MLRLGEKRDISTAHVAPTSSVKPRRMAYGKQLRVGEGRVQSVILRNQDQAGHVGPPVGHTWKPGRPCEQRNIQLPHAQNLPNGCSPAENPARHRSTDYEFPQHHDILSADPANRCWFLQIRKVICRHYHNSRSHCAGCFLSHVLRLLIKGDESLTIARGGRIRG